MTDARLSISQVASRADVPVSTVRYYLSLGLLEPGVRTGSTRTYYSQRHVDALNEIRAELAIRPRPLAALAAERSTQEPGSNPDDPMERRETEILHGATRLFLDHGFASTSIEAIAREAGVSKTTLYQHFATKEDLFVASAHLIFHELYDETWDELRGLTDPRERLALRWRAFLDSYGRWSTMMRLMRGTVVGSDPGLRAAFHTLLEQIARPIAVEVAALQATRGLASDAEPELFAFTVLGMADAIGEAAEHGALPSDLVEGLHGHFIAQF